MSTFFLILCAAETGADLLRVKGAIDPHFPGTAFLPNIKALAKESVKHYSAQATHLNMAFKVSKTE